MTFNKIQNYICIYFIDENRQANYGDDTNGNNKMSYETLYSDEGNDEVEIKETDYKKSKIVLISRKYKSQNILKLYFYIFHRIGKNQNMAPLDEK